MNVSACLKMLICSLCVSVSLTAFEAGQLSPDEALQQLVKGNQRYVKGELEHPNRGFSRRQETVDQQKTFAIILGCADSRVATEILFDLGVGDLFVVRVAGNAAGPLELESIEFAVLTCKSPV